MWILKHIRAPITCKSRQLQFSKPSGFHLDLTEKVSVASVQVLSAMFFLFFFYITDICFYIQTIPDLQSWMKQRVSDGKTTARLRA